jgi:hypothetical protein
MAYLQVEHHRQCHVKGFGQVRADNLDKARQIFEQVSEVVNDLQNRVGDLEEEITALQNELEIKSLTLNNMLEIQNRLLRSFPTLGPRRDSSEDFPPDLRGIPLSDALEIVLRSTDGPLTQDEIADLLEVSGYPLGRNAGRKIHAASLSKQTIRKVRPKTYQFDPSAEDDWMDGNTAGSQGRGGKA